MLPTSCDLIRSSKHSLSLSFNNLETRPDCKHRFLPQQGRHGACQFPSGIQFHVQWVSPTWHSRVGYQPGFWPNSQAVGPVMTSWASLWPISQNQWSQTVKHFQPKTNSEIWLKLKNVKRFNIDLYFVWLWKEEYFIWKKTSTKNWLEVF